MRDCIFISYRRDDARGASGRLYDWLRIAFGRERVFRDVDSIGPGRWRDEIELALARSAVCLAIVGRRWALGENLKRLHDETDMVRLELTSALAAVGKGLTPMPTLVEGAALPRLDKLPEALRPLFADYQARSVTEDGWEDDTRRLIGDIAAIASLDTAPDLDTALRDAGAANMRLAALEVERHLQAGQVEALARTVADLTRQLAVAEAGGPRTALTSAFTGLALGDTRPAEDAFEREFEARAGAAQAERRAMAQAARNVASLAMLRDVGKAVDFYRKALDAQPDDADTLRLLGDALLVAGDLQAASKAFRQALEQAVRQGDAWVEMATHNCIGDVRVAEGDMPAALVAYGQALAIARRRAEGDATDAACQRDLAVCHDRIGNVLATQGDLGAALTAFRASLGIAEGLAARDAANPQWQRDRSVSLEKVGTALVAMGQLSQAMASYRECVALREALAASDPSRTDWQRDLAVGHQKVGEVLSAQGDLPDALAAYQRSLGLHQALAARDATHSGWQRDLSVSHNKVGDVLMAQRKVPQALAAYRLGLPIARALTRRDAANTEWQRDLSVSHHKLGDALSAGGDPARALVAHRKGLALRVKLAARDPDNAQWQRDLSLSHERIGDVLLAQGDAAGALVAFRTGQSVREALVARDAANSGWQRDVAVGCNKVGDVLLAQGQPAPALELYLQAMHIVQPLAERDSANAQWQKDLAILHGKLGAHPQVPKDAQRQHLTLGLEVLRAIDRDGRLAPDRGWIDWFVGALKALDSAGP